MTSTRASDTRLEQKILDLLAACEVQCSVYASYQRLWMSTDILMHDTFDESTYEVETEYRKINDY